MRQEPSLAHGAMKSNRPERNRWRWLPWFAALCLVVSLALIYARRPTGEISQQSLDNQAASQGQDHPLNAYLASGSGGVVTKHPMKIGVDVDNWSGQAKNAAFEQSLVAMKVDFVSWHVQPDEETPEHLGEIVNLCRKHGWSYLFNTEIGNYKRSDPRLKHSDGTYRYDLADSTLKMLRDDPLFLGVVYDETELMQALNGAPDPNGGMIPPYLADTRSMTASTAFDAVSSKVKELQLRYQSYGKRLIFEMTFPAYPFAYARGGALLAPKLLKETYDDLMYSVYRGAALEYKSAELWACIDLWFLDRFPTAGKAGPGYHTPEQLLDALRFANAAGFDYVYVEQYKGLMTTDYKLTSYGRAVVAFQQAKADLPRGDWRTAPVDLYVRRFSDGYWGQDYSSFIPDHPYGSWLPNTHRAADKEWFELLHKLSHGALPEDSDTWDAQGSPFFKDRPYSTMAGLPSMVVYDQYGSLPKGPASKVVDLCANGACRPEDKK